MDQQTEAELIAVDPNQERSRLIDHFKRAYQIIVGLAITLAVLHILHNCRPNIPRRGSLT